MIRRLPLLLLLAFFSVLFLASSAEASGTAPCTLDPGDRVVTICAPAADSTGLVSPVDVVAWAQSSSPVSVIQVYLDGSKVWEQNANEVDVPIEMTPGTHRLTVQAKDASGTFKKTIYVTVSSGGGDPGPTTCSTTQNLTVKICAPLNGSTVDSPVQITSAAYSSSGVRLSQVYVDGAKVYEVAAAAISTQLAMTAGEHRITVQAKDNAGNTFKSTVYATVGAAFPSGCTASGSEVNICTPADGASVASPVKISAAAASTAPIQYTQVYVDNTKAYEEASDRIDVELDMAPGTRRVTVQAADANGTFVKKTIYITVLGDTSSTCAATGGDPSVTICAPQNNSTVNSPVHILAATNSSSKVTVIQVYVDGSKVHEEPDGDLDVQLPMANGTRRVTVQAKNSAGSTFKQTVYVTVSAEPPPPPAFSVSPASVTVAPGRSQQFTASESATWSVDGILGGDTSVGVITSSGLYTAPDSTGQHTITATSTTDSSKTATARVVVANFSGVLTYHNDNQRTGQNLQESTLTPATVNKDQFGKLWSANVDGYVFAQPLYVPNVEVSGKGTRNVVFLATMNNSVYAFDADAPGTALWKWAGGAKYPPMSSTDVGTSNSGPEVGITGTPVVDPASQTIYFVTASDESGTFRHRIHALDIRSGAERAGSGTVLNPTIAGSGTPNTGSGVVTFMAQRQNQRPGLLLDNGVVYVAWGSHHTISPWHGWIVALDAGTLETVGIFNSTPDSTRGGIWQGGAGPATDELGNLYVATGQGSFNANTGGRNYGDTLLKLRARDFRVLDYFTPYNQKELVSYDLDLGSGGVVVLPEQAGAVYPNLALSVGKQGHIYLVNRELMGKFNSADDSQIVQTIYNAVGAQRGAPAYWNGYVYFGGEGDVLKAFKFSNGLLSASPVSKSAQVLDSRGASPAVSSNGDADGIVWVVNRRANYPAILYAYDATNVARLLYTSEQVASRDSLGKGTKFSVPTVANGRVYVGTSNQLVVYGLLN